jgi:hypothetical protein
MVVPSSGFTQWINGRGTKYRADRLSHCHHLRWLRVDPMTPRVRVALLAAESARRENSGESLAPGDPVLFDLDRLEVDLEKALRDAGVGPANDEAFHRSM